MRSLERLARLQVMARSQRPLSLCPSLAIARSEADDAIRCYKTIEPWLGSVKQSYSLSSLFLTDLLVVFSQI